MLPISLAEKIPKVCDPRNSGNDFLERSANFSRARHTDFGYSGPGPSAPAPVWRHRLRCASQHCCAIVDLGFRLALPQTAIPFRGSIPEFPDEQSTGANPRCYDVACGLFARLCRRPHNFGCIFVLSLVAPQTVNRPSGLLAATSVFGGGSFDWIISAGVISRAFATGVVVIQNADPKRETSQEKESARSTGKAGNGNRTRMASLEGWNFTIKLCPREK